MARLSRRPIAPVRTSKRSVSCIQPRAECKALGTDARSMAQHDWTCLVVVFRLFPRFLEHRDCLPAGLPTRFQLHLSGHSWSSRDAGRVYEFTRAGQSWKRPRSSPLPSNIHQLVCLIMRGCRSTFSGISCSASWCWIITTGRDYVTEVFCICH